MLIYEYLYITYALIGFVLIAGALFIYLPILVNKQNSMIKKQIIINRIFISLFFLIGFSFVCAGYFPYVNNVYEIEPYTYQYGGDFNIEAIGETYNVHYNMRTIKIRKEKTTIYMYSEYSNEKPTLTEYKSIGSLDIEYILKIPSNTMWL